MIIKNSAGFSTGNCANKKNSVYGRFFYGVKAMATSSFFQTVELTPEQVELLVEVLEKPPTRIITDEEVKEFEDSLKKGKELFKDKEWLAFWQKLGAKN